MRSAGSPGKGGPGRRAGSGRVTCAGGRPPGYPVATGDPGAPGPFGVVTRSAGADARGDGRTPCGAGVAGLDAGLIAGSSTFRAGGDETGAV